MIQNRTGHRLCFLLSTKQIRYVRCCNQQKIDGSSFKRQNNFYEKILFRSCLYMYTIIICYLQLQTQPQKKIRVSWTSVWMKHRGQVITLTLYCLRKCWRVTVSVLSFHSWNCWIISNKVTVRWKSGRNQFFLILLTLWAVSSDVRQLTMTFSESTTFLKQWKIVVTF